MTSTLATTNRAGRRSVVWFGACAGVLVVLGLSACADHDPELDRVGGSLPEYDGGSTDAGDGGCSLPPADTPGAQIPCAADKILGLTGTPADKCRRCHQNPPLNGAPFPLMTWADTQGIYAKAPIYKRMRNAIDTNYMPFCNGLTCANDFDPPVQSLTVEEKETLLDWLTCPEPVFGVQCSP